LAIHNIFVWSIEVWTSGQILSNSAWIRIMVHDANNRVLLLDDTTDIATAGHWQRVGGTLTLTRDSRSIEVHLIAIQPDRVENGVFFDNVFVAANCSDPVLPATWTRLKMLFR
jgi:hypothetical protein